MITIYVVGNIELDDANTFFDHLKTRIDPNEIQCNSSRGYTLL